MTHAMATDLLANSLSDFGVRRTRIIERASSPSAPLVVALDGGQASASALRMAIALLQPRKAGSRLADLRFEFRARARALAESAHACGARLIVTALRSRQNRLPFGLSNIAPTLLRRATVPVLAVDAGARRAPKTAVAAIDFSMSSMEAALAAVTILETPATLYLLHVEPRIQLRDDTTAANESRAASRLASIARLWSGNGVRVVACALRGDVVEETLGLARRVRADVIACGQSVRHIIERTLIGSTARNLLNVAECSVLVAPAE